MIRRIRRKKLKNLEDKFDKVEDLDKYNTKSCTYNPDRKENNNK